MFAMLYAFYRNLGYDPDMRAVTVTVGGKQYHAYYVKAWCSDHRWYLEDLVILGLKIRPWRDVNEPAKRRVWSSWGPFHWGTGGFILRVEPYGLYVPGRITLKFD